jgi:transposase InsO family protein
MYTKNPYLPRVRRDAAFVAQRKGVRITARYYGVSPGTVSKWVEKAKRVGYHPIPTESSRPRSHPKELPPEIVQAIKKQRRKRNRCAEVVHQELLKDGVSVSLSSVKRTLKKHGLIKERSPWKRWHFSDPRPLALIPGDLVQLDTIHVVPKRYQTYTRFYVYTLLDVFSRWAWAKVYARPNTHNSVFFVRQAQRHAPFSFSYLQSDHGSEFSTWFTENVKVKHRHSRVRKPNDNSHVERFNRTIQEECLRGLRPNPEAYQRAITKYLPYYNEQRLHLGINYQTPMECFQAID